MYRCCCCCCQVLKAVGDEDEKYPYPFELTVRVQLGQKGAAPTLTQELEAKNTGQQGLQACAYG
jgi:hypothetical protein